MKVSVIEHKEKDGPCRGMKTFDGISLNLLLKLNGYAARHTTSGRMDHNTTRTSLRKHFVLKLNHPDGSSVPRRPDKQKSQFGAQNCSNVRIKAAAISNMKTGTCRDMLWHEAKSC
jgi:hypothetical protein